jgi:hypothetical protein
MLKHRPGGFHLFTFVNFLLFLLALFAGLMALCFIFEPSRKRRVLWTLRNQIGWMFGRDVSEQAEVRFIYFTLSGLQDEGLVESQDEDRPAGADEDFYPRTRYRLTEGGRAASNRLTRAAS